MSLSKDALLRLNRTLEANPDLLSESNLAICAKNSALTQHEFVSALQRRKPSQYLFSILHLSQHDKLLWSRVVAFDDEFEICNDKGTSRISTDSTIDWLYVDNYKLHGGKSVRIQKKRLLTRMTNGQTSREFQVGRAFPFYITEKDETFLPHEPFFDAIGNGDLTEICSYLKRDPSVVNEMHDVALPDRAGHIQRMSVTPLKYAVWLNQPDALDCLLDQGARADETNLLLDCALLNRSRQMKSLLDAGLDVNVTNASGVSSLLCAAQSNANACVELLLSRSADPNTITPWGLSPLHAARNSDILKALIAAGANVDLQPSAGKCFTPLMEHLKNERWENCLVLIEAGASLTLRSHDGLNVKEMIDRTASSDQLFERIKNLVRHE